MKAYESVEKFLPTMRMYTNFAVRSIKKICAEIGPREAGSEAELKAQNYMAQQVGDAADEVKQDEFRLSPRAFLGWFRLAGVCLLITLAAGIVNIFVKPSIPYSAYVGCAAFVFIMMMILFEFLTYSEFLDPLFKKATSHNTYCIRRAAGETKRRIILAGHADSSIEWRPTHVGGRSMLLFSFAYPLIGLFYTAAISVVTLVKGDVQPLLVWIGCAFIPGYINLIFFMNYKVCVDGAIDNLTGCMISAAVLKYMGDNDLRFENTEVVCLFTGSEESGIRGAKAAVKQHPEFKEDGVETLFFSIDTIKEYDHLAIYNKDMSGTVTHDPRACSLVRTAGETAEVTLPYATFYAGATDAAAFTKADIPAVSLVAMNPGPPRYYHTRDDKVDIMEPKTIEKALQIALETVYLFDEQGLGVKK